MAPFPVKFDSIQFKIAFLLPTLLDTVMPPDRGRQSRSPPTTNNHFLGLARMSTGCKPPPNHPESLERERKEVERAIVAVWYYRRESTALERYAIQHARAEHAARYKLIWRERNRRIEERQRLARVAAQEARESKVCSPTPARFCT